MEDQNVSLHCCPSEESNLQWVEEIVEKHPEEIELRRSWPRRVEAIIVNEPRNDRQFIDQAEDEKDDDNMIVQCTAKGSIGEEHVESEKRERERDDIGDEKRPESDLMRNMHDRWCCIVVHGVKSIHDYLSKANEEDDCRSSTLK